MIRTITVEAMGTTYCLLYNNEAFFRVQEKYGGDALDKMDPGTKEGIEVIFGIFVILAEQGELARHYCGYPAGNLPDLSDFAFASPGDMYHIVNAIYNAVTMGLERKVPSLEDVDLGLLELEKKRNTRTQE